MNWRTEWKAISDRISGLSTAGQLFVKFWGNKTFEDPYGAIKQELLPQARDTFKSIEQFLEVSKVHLPVTAADCAKRFIESKNNLFLADNPGDYTHLQAVLTNLLSFQTEFTYQISDTSAFTKRLVERAFIHLKRSIIADISIKEKWKEAFNHGETSCEKLGATHLLLHGIWAFKASTEGGRTDLILGKPLKNLSEVENTAEAMVLTEWKVVKNQGKELEKKLLKALRQAKKYSSGVLAGFELANYRYLVIVSENDMDMPEDIRENEIIYRYVNIAVDPLLPSKS